LIILNKFFKAKRSFGHINKMGASSGVLLAFITSQERADSFAAEKWLYNRQGLHHIRFETIFRGNETLCGKKF